MTGSHGPIVLRDLNGGGGEICRPILAALPHWFGIPASVEEYVDVAEHSPCVVASIDDTDVGISVIVSHGQYAAEISVMGVLPEFHRQGIGRSMLGHVEVGLAAAGVEFLQVKTLSARKRDAGYQKTRAFYSACGFRPLEEFPALWDEDNPALLMVKAITPEPSSEGNR